MSMVEMHPAEPIRITLINRFTVRNRSGGPAGYTLDRELVQTP